MSKDRLVYLPLGGAGEIGMNCYLYGYGPEDRERFILVDLGVTFPDMDTTPGVDLILPDLSYIVERRDRLEAVFITHAHEDHVGALGHLWERLGVPVHARAFTANIAQRKMEEHGQPQSAIEVAAPWPHKVQAGPFSVSFLPLSHSIPESAALLIETPGGRVIHSGDFKIDADPVVGEPFDPELLREASRGGIRALVCDSTNVLVNHPGRSESALALPIGELIAQAKGAVVATTFASNVARVKTLAEAGKRADRAVCLLGRAMRRMIEAAVETGVLTDFPSTVSPEEAADIPRDHLMLIVTGSQGERRAASAQLANGKYLGLELARGDLFLFSSKTIPGNERGVIAVMNALSEKGVEIIDDEGGRYHVSGHANRPDLKRMHDLIDPDIVVPMHGEHRHLTAHTRLAAEGGREGILAVNGTMVDLSGERPGPVEAVETGRIYVDGLVQVGALDGVVRDRIRIARNGLAIVTLIIDEDGTALGDPWCELRGLPELGVSKAPLAELIEADLAALVSRKGGRILEDDDALEEAIRRTVRQTAQNEIGKKPEVSVIVSRLA